MKARLPMAWLAVLLPALPAVADELPRATFSLTAGASLGALRFAQSRSFMEFAEAARLDARYEMGAGPAVEVLAEYRFTRRLGLAGAFSWAGRDARVSLEATLPHPFYVGRPRMLSAERGSLAYAERAGHLDLVVRPAMGRLQVLIFMGPSLFHVEAELIEHLEYAQEYPYDSVRFLSAPGQVLEASPLGFNLGAALERSLSRHLGLRLQARFSRARVSLRPAEGEAVGFTAGGFQAGAGLRLQY